MTQCQVRRTVVVERDVRYALEKTVPRDAHGWYRQGMFQDRIGGDDSFDPPGQQKGNVLIQIVKITPVRRGNKEVLVAGEHRFDTADDEGAVSIANFCSDDTDGKGVPCAQIAGKEIGAIVEFSRRGVNPVLRALRDCPRYVRIIQDGGNCSLRQPEVFG